MEEFLSQFSLVPEGLKQAVRNQSLEALVAFWGQLAPEVESLDDVTEPIRQSLEMTALVLNAWGMSMMSPEQLEASRQREISVLQLN